MTLTCVKCSVIDVTVEAGVVFARALESLFAGFRITPRTTHNGLGYHMNGTRVSTLAGEASWLGRSIFRATAAPFAARRTRLGLRVESRRVVKVMRMAAMRTEAEEDPGVVKRLDGARILTPHFAFANGARVVQVEVVDRWWDVGFAVVWFLVLGHLRLSFTSFPFLYVVCFPFCL